MAINIYVKNRAILSRWHLIDHSRVKYTAKKIMEEVGRSAVNLRNLATDPRFSFLSGDLRTVDIPFLRSLGIVQIVKEGKDLSCNIKNGYLSALNIETSLKQTDRLATVQIAPRDEDLPEKRVFASLDVARNDTLSYFPKDPADPDKVLPDYSAAKPVPIDKLFDKYDEKAKKLVPDKVNETKGYNMSVLPKTTTYEFTYYGPGSIVEASQPGNRIPNEGEISTLRAVSPRPEFLGDNFGIYGDEFPSIIIKDETRPSGPFGLITGGLTGAINFGLKRLYHLVLENARFILANINDDQKQRKNYTVFMGKSNRYIKFFGKLMVGEETLDEVTKKQDSAPFMVLTRPLTIKEAEESPPKSVALVDKKTGQIKYLFPPRSWKEHVEDLKKKMGTKSAYALISRALDSDLKGNGELTEEEKEQSKVFKEDMIRQKDVFETEWDLVEVIPGSFVAQKEWLNRLNTVLQKLSEEFRDLRGGKEMARVLREYGNHYNLQDLVYLAMSTSDAGDFEAGFVGKFPHLKGVIDSKYLNELYKRIRGDKDRYPEYTGNSVFQGKKIFAIDIGEAAEVISFSDEKTGKLGQALQKGEYAFTKALEACVTYSRNLADEWIYWRKVLGFLPSKRTIKNSYVGCRKWYRPSTWFFNPFKLLNPFNLLKALIFGDWKLSGAWRTDLIIIDSILPSTFIPKGPAIIVGSEVIAEENVATPGPFYSIWSRAQLGKGLIRSSLGTLLYHYDNIRRDVGGIANTSGLYALRSEQGPLPGSGMHEPVKEIRTEFPKPGDRAEITGNKEEIEKRNKMINEALGSLSPDAVALREQELLRQILRKIPGLKSDSSRYVENLIKEEK